MSDTRTAAERERDDLARQLRGVLREFEEDEESAEHGDLTRTATLDVAVLDALWARVGGRGYVD